MNTLNAVSAHNTHNALVSRSRARALSAAGEKITACYPGPGPALSGCPFELRASVLCPALLHSAHRPTAKEHICDYGERNALSGSTLRGRVASRWVPATVTERVSRGRIVPHANSKMLHRNDLRGKAHAGPACVNGIGVGR